MSKRPGRIPHRNPLVAVVMKKSVRRHGKSNKAARKAARQDLRRDMRLGLA